jgi:hypothetical protein
MSVYPFSDVTAPEISVQSVQVESPTFVIVAVAPEY